MARESLSVMRGAFSSRSKQFDAMLQDVIALLAYVQPEVGSKMPQKRNSHHFYCHSYRLTMRQAILTEVAGSDTMSLFSESYGGCSLQVPMC